MERFVFVRTSEIIPDHHLPFPEAWNMNPTEWMPDAVADLRQWVQCILEVSHHEDRSWKKISENRWIAKNHGFPSKKLVVADLDVDLAASGRRTVEAKRNNRKLVSTNRDDFSSSSQLPSEKRRRLVKASSLAHVVNDGYCVRTQGEVSPPPCETNHLSTHAVIDLEDVEETDNEVIALVWRGHKVLPKQPCSYQLVLPLFVPSNEAMTEFELPQLGNALERVSTPGFSANPDTSSCPPRCESGSDGSPEERLFEEGLQALDRASTLLGEGLLSLRGRKDLQIQLDSQALEIAALKAELANRKSQDVAAAELTSRLKADLQEAKTGFERATISFIVC
ncbi:uncharacterized protein LOC107868317 isoform X1 [Capsicum annuum]|uniref:uncharacterized protein LOC107868317 isoform X1 n=2 Tax=Capsicum annuum TaxID=4072 RepID=UPI001FB121BA|nr:uncharacterized protein LOC107868317 isoform X1 [Capsicum annuum]XP_047266635.1 uncharacterized protein LOC107868317 isoform X1 [Capsicum annuum]XP_047266636.1 uncharacterized protein LOC107868317 isoform X1 [Capsicum annuum]XP_047266637.1 uncharacterized protein LOC107868317 isoform X1 [Capsicum annuum]XP_047266638.1 uncharacterized protein LOC107868317 isoform X1 [Capsicum annuum]XP_047266639.1 uncharacterized protein LOC107868317 isoform X1 [Capsicum annuum]XP_047266640.1 uncharacterize